MARTALADLLWPLDAEEPRSPYQREMRASFEPAAWTLREGALDAWTAGAREARQAGLEPLATELDARVAAIEELGARLRRSSTSARSATPRAPRGSRA